MKEDIPDTIPDDDLPRPRILTEEESLAMRESLARKNFGMSLVESRKAYEAGEFDDDRERHGKLISMAMLLPEYWEER